jgi:hypothetical protein
MSTWQIGPSLLAALVSMPFYIFRVFDPDRDFFLILKNSCDGGPTSALRGHPGRPRGVLAGELFPWLVRRWPV